MPRGLKRIFCSLLPWYEFIYFYQTNVFIEVEDVGRRARVILGDETGIVKAFLYKVDAIKAGESIVVFKAEAKVVK